VVKRTVFDEADFQVIFSNIIQWLLYGNHPSPVAFSGMAIVLVAGLYGVVSAISAWSRAEADLQQIYGPADTPKEGDDVEAGSESTRPLLSGNEEAAEYGGVVENES
jgi:hypothetical protein